MPADWLVELERSLAADPDGESLATTLVVLAGFAGREIPLDLEEVRGAARRSLLLMASGGGIEQGLDLNGRAVGAFSEELDVGLRRAALLGGLEALLAEAADLPHTAEAVQALIEDQATAWRAYACAVLATELEAED
jgi:hypothetical protein